MTSKPSALSKAAVTEESTPPDMATTTRVSRGEPSTSRLLSIAVVSGSNLCAARSRCRADGPRATLLSALDAPIARLRGQARLRIERRPFWPGGAPRRYEDGRADQTIGSKDVLAKHRGLPPPPSWVRPRESADAAGASLVAAQQSARGWTSPHARRLRPAPRAPARNWQRLGRRRGGRRRQCGRHRPELRQILSGGHYLPRDLAVECVRSLMTEPLRPRAKYVIGPDGSPLTIADLPAPGTKRWVIRRKAEVVAAVRGGLLSLEEACSRYTLTVEEFLSWQYSIDQHGLAGLRTTRIQQYRQ